MKVTAIIPARLSSERLPEKVLLDINGLPMVMHIFNTLINCKRINSCSIATDSEEIKRVVIKHGASVIDTGTCRSGTERVIKASASIQDFDILINVQGDEPMIRESHINALIEVFEDNPSAQIATLVEKFIDESDLRDPNNVKVVLSETSKALYFSRSVIPYSHSLESYHYKHIGIYAFRKDVLSKVQSIEPTDLSKQERLEQLDWLVAEIPIFAKMVDGNLIGVDTPNDLEKVRKLMSSMN